MISTRKLVVVALGVAALMTACTSDPTLPPKPDAPQQITTSVVYSHAGNGLPSSDVYAILAVSNGELWMGTFAGVARYPNANADPNKAPAAPAAIIVNEVNGLPHPQVRSMAELSGKVYVGTWGGGLGVYDIAGNSWTQIRPAASGATNLTNGFISEVAASPTESKLYLSTNNGVFIYTPGSNSFTHFSTVDPDAPDFDVERFQQTVSSLEVVDDAGLVSRWYGPRTDSRYETSQAEFLGVLVSKSASTEFRYTTVNSGLVEPNVNDIYYDTVRQTYWVSYVSQGISEVNVATKTWTSNTLVQGLPSNTVYSVTRAGDEHGGSTLWAATQNGLAKLVGDHWQAYGKSGGLPSDRVRRVYSDDGKRLWLGTIDAGAVKLKV
ncbi:MAG TPA: two-component regulator propeller domain-containing protein [Candidatus Krumholzibacteria bacterium]|nr:two-component regulator propeller domain-containing protein [Candidatus Krumholzibacteria bacterium]